MKKLLINALKLVLFLGIGATILIVLYQKLNESYQLDCADKGIPADECSLIDKVLSDFQQSNYAVLLLVVLIYMLSNVHRTYRWKALIDSMGYRTKFFNVFNSTMLLYFANLGFPRLGEFVRCGTMARYEKIPFEKLGGTAAVDRIFDLVSFGLVFLLGLTLEYDTIWNYVVEQRSGAEHEGISSLWYVVGGMLVLAAAVVYHYRSQLSQSKLVMKAREMIRGFIDGLRSISKLKNVPAFIFHSVMIWVMYYLMTYVCFMAFEPTQELGARVALMVFVFGSIGMIIPSPGGMGSYHGLVVAALMLYGVAGDDAFSFAMIIFFTVQIFGNVLFGLIALIALPFTNRGYEPNKLTSRID